MTPPLLEVLLTQSIYTQETLCQHDLSLSLTPPLKIYIATCMNTKVMSEKGILAPETSN